MNEQPGEGPAEFACVPAESACPAEWPVISLNDHPQGDGWNFEGNTADAENLTEGTCGGGSANQILSLTTVSGGFFVCEIDAAGEDTVLYARAFCGVESPGAELVCNDDALENDLGFQSRIRFYAPPAGETFIFVDAFGAAVLEYTLNCGPDFGADQ